VDFDQLETFLEVVKHLNFSRAAEKRFRTQPAISAQIRSIEEEVGAKLLDRSGGKVAITAAGKVFQEYAEQALESRRNVIHSIAEMQHVPRGEIVVGANEGTCLYVLPEVFAEFKRQYPGVGVNIDRMESAKVLESVIANSVDFGVVALPVPDKRLTVVLIHKDELVLITPPDHPLAKLKKVEIGEIAPYPLLVPEAGRTRDAIEQAFDELGLRPTISMELDSSEILKRFVEARVGVGFIAQSNVRQDVRAGRLAAIPFAETVIRRDVALVFRKDKALSRAALAFIEIAVQRSTGERLSRETATRKATPAT
jgi:DNA-binding transcriptional LysR family regulator